MNIVSPQRWTRRTYLLDGKEMDSSMVSGIIHKATKNLGPCACNAGHDIEPGQYYAVFLRWLDGNKFRLDCLFPDHESCVFGVSVVRRKANDGWGNIRTKTFIICKRLSYDFKAWSYHYGPDQQTDQAGARVRGGADVG